MESFATTFKCKTYLSQPRILVTDEFIERNNLSLRTAEEIFQKYEEVKERDFFGFGSGVFLEFLPWEMVKSQFKEDYQQKVESGEIKHDIVTDIRESAQDFLDYMNFAWGKAEDERGISASRSISKLGAWLWIMNRSDLSELISDDGFYNPYGAPALIAVCGEMGIEVPESLVEFLKHK